MTIAEQITRIKNAKAAIKRAIQNKGVAVSDTAKLDEYPALINSIETGSGSGESYVNPDFYELRTKGGTNYQELFSRYAYPGGVQYTLDLSHWDTSEVINMSKMFYYCNALVSVDLSNWDTSKLKRMDDMFYYCETLTELDIKHFDVSNVDTANGMFNYCRALTSLDLSGWTFKDSIYNFGNMFNECNSLTSVNITGWGQYSKVTSVSYMFTNCKVLKDIIGELDLSGLTGGFYPGSSSNPFKGCNALETLYLKNIYKDCTMTNASKWSINLADTKVKDECLIYIINELPDLINDKGLTATDKIVLTLPPSNTLTEEQKQVARDKGWQVVN